MTGYNKKKAGVIGYPISHSLSPRIHNYWLQKYNINATYEAIALSPENLEKFLREMPEKGYVGVNVTIPHKEAVLEFLDGVDIFAKTIGAVNTIVVQGKKLIGKNTDTYGFRQNLKNGNLPIKGGTALVLGAGGAAKAVCKVLLDTNDKVKLINRTYERAKDLAGLFSNRPEVFEWNKLENAMRDVSLLVNTTSLGMKGQPPLDISLDTLPKDAVVTDIVYNPLITPLLARAKARGNPTVDGLGMLLYQAQGAFAEWFGITPEVTPELREHVLQGLK